MGQDQVSTSSVGQSFNVLWKPPKFGNTVKSVIKSSSVRSSQIGVMFDQLMVSFNMSMSHNVM